MNPLSALGALERRRIAQSNKPSRKGTSGTKVYVRELGTDKTIPYGSITTAAEFLGVKQSSLTYRKRRGLNTPMIAAAEDIKGKPGYLLTFGESNRIERSSYKKVSPSQIGIVLTDLETGLDIPYDTLADAAAFLGLNPSVLSTRKAKGSVTPIEAKAKDIKGKLYSLIFDGVAEPKRKGKHHLQPIKVDLKDLETELIASYDSLEDAGEALGLDP